MSSNPITKSKFYKAWDNAIRSYNNKQYKKAKSLFLEAAEIQEKMDGEVSPAVEEYIAKAAMKLHERKIAKHYFEEAIGAAENFKSKEGKIDPEKNEEHFKEVIGESEKALKKLTKVS